MDNRILVLIIGLLSFFRVDAQDSLFVYSPKYVNDTRAFLNESAQFWKFEKGDNSEWSSPDYDDTDWENYHPSSLVLELTEDSGRLEGWFRFRFRLSDSLQNEQLTFILDDYGQALEVYLDGIKVHTHGQFPNDTLNFQGAKTKDATALVPLTPIHDSVYTLALHYLHMPLEFPFTSFVNDRTIQFSISLFDIDSIKRIYENRIRNVALELFVATIVVVIFILFWFFWLLDRKNSLLLFIALCMTGFLIFTVSLVIRGNLFNMSIENAYILQYLPQIIGSSLMIGTIPLIFAKIFRGAVPKYLYTIASIVLFVALSDVFLGIHGMDRSFLSYAPIVVIGSVFLYCSFLIVRVRKKIRGAQWAIIIGLLIFLFFVSFMVISTTYFTSIFSGIGVTGQLFIKYSWQIIFPLSLMAYTILRFREAQNDVKENAEEVVRITEEKRLQAVQQQEVLEQKVEQRTKELTNSLEELKSTQTQLIQSEKMASLGELTAGIAHEIQNPLNFVNNFSDVSSELIGEAKEELEKGDISEVKDLLDDLNQNLEKISHHGGRASSIVKGMLDHSRESSGEKVETDINNLVDEYLRLSYHGLRAKDNNFKASFETSYDENLPKISLIAQDVGRVFLNTINNAFQAVHEKSLSSNNEYVPKISVRTKKVGEKIVVDIEDNGPGISKEIIDKIFQPFFTTKPTGQGTGLGLSISYDIIKAHGGEIKVDSSVQGTTFSITLPHEENR